MAGKVSWVVTGDVAALNSNGLTRVYDNVPWQTPWDNPTWPTLDGNKSTQVSSFHWFSPLHGAALVLLAHRAMPVLPVPQRAPKL